jgi:hypothetical protein
MFPHYYPLFKVGEESVVIVMDIFVQVEEVMVG